MTENLLFVILTQISISAGTIISGGWTQTDTDGSRGTCRDFEKERRRTCSKRNAAAWKRDQHAYTGRTAPSHVSLLSWFCTV